ncbi:MAG: acetyl-CoA carboxylase biotin carboxylase subunit, partial [Nitrososphaera sp.]|nr:acetyl-CoA carboxylase biotin carboxylase subunit [Nitrososphaera sp.]
GEFVIEGINTTIPLYKTIMDEPNFIKGNISTDYLDKFKMFDKMREDVNNHTNTKATAAVAAVLLQSELGRRANTPQGPAKKSNWKNRVSM